MFLQEPGLAVNSQEWVIYAYFSRKGWKANSNTKQNLSAPTNRQMFRMVCAARLMGLHLRSDGSKTVTINLR